MIKPAVVTLIDSLGSLGLEQHVHAQTALRIAEVMDGTAEDGPPPLYALPGLARELRAALAALSGTVTVGRGIPEDELAAMLRGEI